jgi:hypothetical protein
VSVPPQEQAQVIGKTVPAAPRTTSTFREGMTADIITELLTRKA